MTRKRSKGRARQAAGPGETAYDTVGLSNAEAFKIASCKLKLDVLEVQDPEGKELHADKYFRFRENKDSPPVNEAIEAREKRKSLLLKFLSDVSVSEGITLVHEETKETYDKLIDDIKGLSTADPHFDALMADHFSALKRLSEELLAGLDSKLASLQKEIKERQLRAEVSQMTIDGLRERLRRANDLKFTPQLVARIKKADRNPVLVA